MKTVYQVHPENYNFVGREEKTYSSESLDGFKTDSWELVKSLTVSWEMARFLTDSWDRRSQDAHTNGATIDVSIL